MHMFLEMKEKRYVMMDLAKIMALQEKIKRQ
jgi:hypothetical protein